MSPDTGKVVVFTTVRHHDWQMGELVPNGGGEYWWTCKRCGTIDSSGNEPWVDRWDLKQIQDRDLWHEFHHDGWARRISITSVNCGGGPAWTHVLSDCDLEAVRLLMTI